MTAGRQSCPARFAMAYGWPCCIADAAGLFFVFGQRLKKALRGELERAPASAKRRFASESGGKLFKPAYECIRILCGVTKCILLLDKVK